MFPESSWLYVHVLLEALWYKSTLHTADVALLETAQGPVAEQVLGWLTAEGSSAPPHHSFSALPLQEGRRTFDENKKNLTGGNKDGETTHQLPLQTTET